MYKFLIEYILVIFCLILPLSAQVDFTSSNLPIVIIETNEQEISDDTRIIADMYIIYNSSGLRNNITDSANNYSGKISIEIRGQSSSGWDKKSYGLETQDENGENRNVSLLDLPEENDWILHAPFFDRSLMRNVLVFDLARKMGWYSSRTRYCELVLNDEYVGIYVLMEKIKRDKNRIDIAKLTSDEISGDDLTGGYIIKIDKDPWNDGFDSPFPPYEGSTKFLRYQYHYPKADDIVEEQQNYIEQFVSDYETLMYKGDYSDPEHGYSKFLNVASFIDYIILNELSRNVDGYRLSTYFYKDKESKGGKLTAGPVWDYNFSFGNAGYYNSWYIEGWQLLYFADNTYFHNRDGYQSPFWWKTLFTEASFILKLYDRWQQLRQTILSKDSIFETMNMYADSTAEARERNFELWPGPGEPNSGSGWFPMDPRSSQIDTYEDEIGLFEDWISDRIDWMDENLQLLTSLTKNRKANIPLKFALEQNYPNPFNPKTIIKYQIPNESFVQIFIYNMLGQKVKTLIEQNQIAGLYSLKFNSHDLSSGAYIYQITLDNGISKSKKMILLH